MATTEVKSAHEWLKDSRVQDVPGKKLYIKDADGWRHNDGVTMDTPISLENFIKRLNECTLIIRTQYA